MKCGTPTIRKTWAKIEEDARSSIPDELWMLWIPDAWAWVVSTDEAPGGTTYLVAFSKAEALAAMDHQLATYDVACVPVRVK